MQDSKKLKAIKDHADKVTDDSKILVAITENLYMPQIQLCFLFPAIVMSFSSEPNNKEPREQSNADPVDPIDVLTQVSENWTTILLIFSVTSSIISMAGAQSSIYFTKPSKRHQKTRVFTFLVVLLQVLPKILTFQLYTFGVEWVLRSELTL